MPLPRGADPGGRGWPATAYSPRTQMLYLPMTEFCANTTPLPIEPGKTFTGAHMIVHGEPLYDNFPEDIHSGDTYGPVNYAATPTRPATAPPDSATWF